MQIIQYHLHVPQGPSLTASLARFVRRPEEQVDSIDASRYGPKAAAEIRLARKDLVQFVQKAEGPGAR